VEEYLPEQIDGAAFLSFGGSQQREIGRHGLGTEERSAPEGYLAEDNRQTKGLLGMIVGRGHPVDLQKGEQVPAIPFGVGNTLPEIFRIRVGQWRWRHRVPRTRWSLGMWRFGLMAL